MRYFDSTHEWVVAVVEELKTEVSEVKSYTQSWPPRHIRIYDWSTVFGSFASSLVAIKLYVVNGFQRRMTD